MQENTARKLPIAEFVLSLDLLGRPDLAFCPPQPDGPEGPLPSIHEPKNWLHPGSDQEPPQKSPPKKPPSPKALPRNRAAP
jgi:hypothetical protein